MAKWGSSLAALLAVALPLAACGGAQDAVDTATDAAGDAVDVIPVNPLPSPEKLPVKDVKEPVSAFTAFHFFTLVPSEPSLLPLGTIFLVAISIL